MGKLVPPWSSQFVTYDLEFLDTGETIDFISIGMVSGDGRELYAVSNAFDVNALLRNEWMRDNVWPHLPVDKSNLQEGSGRGVGRLFPKFPCGCVKDDKGGALCTHGCGNLDYDHPDVRTPGQIKRMVSDFISASHPKDVDVERDNVQLWAYFGAYDHVALAQLFGRMIDLPHHIPMHTNDLKTEVLRLGGISIPPQRGSEHNALADARYNLKRAAGIWAAHGQEQKS